VVLKDVKLDRSAWLSAIICALLLIVIFYSIYIRVRMYMLGMSLWTDEARLAESILDRTMLEMLTPPLANMQTAPVLYLVVVKTLTMIFGASEAVLRIYSFAALLGMLILQGVLLRRVFRVSGVFTLFSVAVSATLGYYIYYSNELKPYMGDAAFILIVLLGYYAYREGFFGSGLKSAVVLGSLFSVCMLFSTPAVFLAGSVFIVEFLSRCIRKDRKAILYIVIGGLIFIAVFALNYLLWLKPIATFEGMIDYWNNRKFDFLMTDKAVISQNISIIRNLLSPLGQAIWITLPFAIFGFAISLARRNIYTAAVGLFLFILLIASALDKYPIETRLWNFLYVIIFIYAFVFIHSIVKTNKIIPVILALAILLPNMTYLGDYGRGADWTVWAGNQANPLIAYVRENIREGETLYSWETANLIVKYKNGYHNYRIGNVDNDNIIFGTTDVGADIEKVLETDGAYILFYHDNYLRTGYFIERLKKSGFFELIMDVNDTQLYWFTDDIAKVKAAASLSMISYDAGGGKLSGVLNVENTGATVFAPGKPIEYIIPTADYDLENYGRVFAVLHKSSEPLTAKNAMGQMILGEIAAPLRPGETAEIVFERNGIEPGEYRIDLVTYGKYVFSGLGTEPVSVTVSR